MIEIKLADRVLSNGKVMKGKEKSFDSGYAAWKFYDDERPGVLEKDLKMVSEERPSKKTK